MNEKQKEAYTKYVGFGLIMGVAVGFGFGLVVSGPIHAPMFAAAGAGIGIVTGSAIGHHKITGRRNDEGVRAMAQADTGSIRFFVVATYLLFLLLFLITGVTVGLGAPEIVQIVMKNVCAWTSTFVLLLFFKRLCPGRGFLGFLKAQFTPVRFSDFAVPAFIQLGLAAGAIGTVMLLGGASLETVEVVSLSGLFPLLLINITAGPTGEQLGWRAFALQEVQKRRSPLAASLWVGLLWGVWHLPLWLVSGYAGLELLLYSGSCRRCRCSI